MTPTSRRDEAGSAAAQPIVVALVIILYRTAEPLPHFLDCLAAQSLADWRLVVIDNASPDDSRDIVAARGDGRISIIRNARNLGFAAAANQGLRAGFALGAPFCVLINVDTSFDPSFLAAFVAARDHLGAAVIAPRIDHAEQPGEAWYAGGHFEDGWIFENVHEERDAAADTVPRTVGFASGCCLGLTRDAVDRTGLLDESFFVYWEDVDLSLRFGKAGVPIHYVPRPVLLHAGASASDGARSASHIRLYYASYMVLLRKHFGWRRALQVMARVLLKELGRNAAVRLPLRRLAAAMVRGLNTRLRPEPRLERPE